MEMCQQTDALYCFCCLDAQSRPTLCDPTDCSPPGFSVHGISRPRILEISHFLLLGIFLTQGSNLSLWHWQEQSLLLSLQGSLMIFMGFTKSKT